MSASLGRSSIQHAIGAKSQIASTISSAILVGVIYGIGNFLKVLPKAVLASIIVVNLKRLLLQINETRLLWKVRVKTNQELPTVYLLSEFDIRDSNKTTVGHLLATNSMF